MRTTTDQYAAQRRAESYLREWARTLGDALPSVDGVHAVVDRHRVRVSVRRLRVALELFAGLYPEREVRQLDRELQRLGRALGAVRALDVNGEQLRALARRPDAVTQAALKVLVAEQATQLQELAAVQQAVRTARLSSRLDRLLARPQRQWTAKRLLKCVRARLNDRRDKMRRCWARHEAKGTPRAFHKLRLAVKHYRYAVLAAGVVFPPPHRPREKALADVQDQMGACRDLAVVRDWVAEQEPSLGDGAQKLVDILKQKHKQSLRQCRRHLVRETGWRKKIKLELEHD